MKPSDKPPVMIISGNAQEYAAHVAGTTYSIPCSVCDNTAAALREYSGQTVLFGMPDMIAAVIDQMPEVQWVQSTWAGVRPLLEGRRQDYLLTGIKGVFGPLMSEYVIAYLLAHELRVIERAEFQRRHVWHDLASGTLRGKKAGIMGTGSIGRHIAAMLLQFGMQVSGLSRSGDPAENFRQVFPPDQLLRFLRDLDYLVAVLPETSETRGLLDQGAFDALPDHAVLLNIGRANVVDHPALLAALRDGRLAGAVLDVFDTEPLPADSPLWTAPGMTITAHVAAHSHPGEITPVFLENYRRFIERRPLKYLIDFERGY